MLTELSYWLLLLDKQLNPLPNAYVSEMRERRMIFIGLDTESVRPGPLSRRSKFPLSS